MHLRRVRRELLRRRENLVRAMMRDGVIRAWGFEPVRAALRRRERVMDLGVLMTTRG